MALVWRKNDIAPHHSETESNDPLPSMSELDSNESPIALSESSDSTSGLDDWELALNPRSFIPLDTPPGSPFPKASTSTMALVPMVGDIAGPVLIPGSTRLKPKRFVSFLYACCDFKGPDTS
jgi:hypothetical protein